jgi:GNAT superfamily N-acetyltransferase
MKLEIRRVADLTADEQSALRTLSLAVYPPEDVATWPGRAIAWAPAQWSVIGWDTECAALCHVGVILREARWNERAVKVGGIGGVKTHPASRRQGFASAAIQAALDFFRNQEDVNGTSETSLYGPRTYGARLVAGWGAPCFQVFITLGGLFLIHHCRRGARGTGRGALTPGPATAAAGLLTLGRPSATSGPGPRRLPIPPLTLEATPRAPRPAASATAGIAWAGA